MWVVAKSLDLVTVLGPQGVQRQQVVTEYDTTGMGDFYDLIVRHTADGVSDVVEMVGLDDLLEVLPVARADLDDGTELFGEQCANGVIIQIAGIQLKTGSTCECHLTHSGP